MQSWVVAQSIAIGEPIEPEVWRWYYESVGKGEAVIVDTWWQTETGGFLGSTLPGIDPAKPGSCGPAALGILPTILDEDGNVVGTRYVDVIDPISGEVRPHVGNVAADVERSAHDHGHDHDNDHDHAHDEDGHDEV